MSGYSAFAGELGFDFLPNCLVLKEGPMNERKKRKEKKSRQTSSLLDCFLLVSEWEMVLWKPDTDDIGGAELLLESVFERGTLGFVVTGAGDRARSKD